MDIRRVDGDLILVNIESLSNHRYDGDGTEWIIEKGEDGKLYKMMMFGYKNFN